jgi:UDP-4-amino-4,6-dideoxy-N-acetyl-beta-L-altrosamine N-acetyltransferase
MIIGKKTVLLPFDEKYLHQVRKWINQPDVRAGTGTEGPVCDYSHSRWYQLLMDDPARRFFIIGDGVNEDASPVGLIGLCDLNLRTRTGKYCIYIGEVAKRRCGFAGEATLLILGFGFNTIGLHRIYLQVLENNSPALGMYRKLGFTQDGVAREHYFSNGKYLNMIVFSMLEQEYRELQG